MKTTNRTPEVLSTGNLKYIDQVTANAKLKPEVLGLLRLIADMFDEIADGKNVYMVIGSTSNRSAFSLAVKGDLSPGTLYAADISEMGNLANDLL